jgi:pSer/pThr/pTyr-binding forkhead associated (FHA) protein
MQVTLLVRAPKKPEKRVLVESDVVIGRGKDCNLQVLSNDVSRQHCRLVIGESGVAIRDLGSGNGTFLNGQKTKPNTNASLITGDIVRIGPLVIKVEFPATSPQPATVPVNSPTDEAAITADADAIAEQFLEPADRRRIRSS